MVGAHVVGLVPVKVWQNIGVAYLGDVLGPCREYLEKLTKTKDIDPPYEAKVRK